MLTSSQFTMQRAAWLLLKRYSKASRAQKHTAAAVVAGRVTDTIVQLDDGKSFTVDRSKLIRMQTPQTLQFNRIKQAYDTGDLSVVTDDCALYIAAGYEPRFASPKARRQTRSSPRVRTGRWRWQPTHALARALTHTGLSRGASSSSAGWKFRLKRACWDIRITLTHAPLWTRCSARRGWAHRQTISRYR